MPQDSQRERLLNHAATAFARIGYAGASVRTIADAAGINGAMVAYYFESKEGLFRAVLADRLERTEERVAWAEKAAGKAAAPRRARLHCWLVEFPDLLHIVWGHALFGGTDFPHADCRGQLQTLLTQLDAPGELAAALLASPTPLMDWPESEREALAERLAPKPNRRPRPHIPAAPAPEPQPLEEPPEPVRYPRPGDDFLDGFVD